MLPLRKLSALCLKTAHPRYFFFESMPQSSFSSEDEDAKLQKIFKNFENNQASLTPQKLVEHLDKFVIGQHQAKKAIACAFRNRWRRKDLPGDLRAQITPKNLLIKGPTGCGKTQIARRLAKLTDSPFIRVEATKYTQVGYVGKDVSSIIQDNEDWGEQLQGQARSRLKGTQRTRQA